MRSTNLFKIAAIIKCVHFGSNLQNDKDKENFSKLVGIIKAANSGKAVGVFAKDGFPGEFCKTWKEVLKENSFETVDISSSIAYIMAPKEEPELSTIKKSSMVTADVFGKYLKEHIMEVIDAEKVIFFVRSIFIIQIKFRNYYFISHYHAMCIV